MPVKIASRFITRFMRGANKEAISSTPASSNPDDERTRKTPKSRPLTEAGHVSRQFGLELHQQTSAYTGIVDEFGCPGNTVDSWRLEFSRLEIFKAANGSSDPKKQQG